MKTAKISLNSIDKVHADGPALDSVMEVIGKYTIE